MQFRQWQQRSTELTTPDQHARHDCGSQPGHAQAASIGTQSALPEILEKPHFVAEEPGSTAKSEAEPGNSKVTSESEPESNNGCPEGSSRTLRFPLNESVNSGGGAAVEGRNQGPAVKNRGSGGSYADENKVCFTNHQVNKCTYDKCIATYV